MLMTIEIPLAVHAIPFYQGEDSQERKITKPWEKHIKREIKKHYDNSINVASINSTILFKTKQTIPWIGSFAKNGIEFLEDGIANILAGRNGQDISFILLGGELNQCHLTNFKGLIQWTDQNLGYHDSVSILLPQKGVFDSNDPPRQVASYCQSNRDYQKVWEQYLAHAKEKLVNPAINYTRKGLLIKVKSDR